MAQGGLFADVNGMARVEGGRELVRRLVSVCDRAGVLQAVSGIDVLSFFTVVRES